RMSSALDAAGLAAGKTITTPPASVCPPPPTFACEQQWATQEATRFFYANFPAGYLGSTILGTISVQPSPDLSTLTLTVKATQQTVFMRLFGINPMNVSAASTVTRGTTQGMELVLVLDNTGSMNGALPGQTTTKIQALGTAVTQLINILFGTN